MKVKEVQDVNGETVSLIVTGAAFAGAFKQLEDIGWVTNGHANVSFTIKASVAEHARARNWEFSLLRLQIGDDVEVEAGEY